MKKAGIVVIIIGALLTVFSLVTFKTKEKVVEIGELSISQDKSHTLNIPPYVGVGVMVLGGILFFTGKKK